MAGDQAGEEGALENRALCPFKAAQQQQVSHTVWELRVWGSLEGDLSKMFELPIARE